MTTKTLEGELLADAKDVFVSDLILALSKRENGISELAFQERGIAKLSSLWKNIVLKPIVNGLEPDEQGLIFDVGHILLRGSQMPAELDVVNEQVRAYSGAKHPVKELRALLDALSLNPVQGYKSLTTVSPVDIPALVHVNPLTSRVDELLRGLPDEGLLGSVKFLLDGEMTGQVGFALAEKAKQLDGQLAYQFLQSGFDYINEALLCLNKARERLSVPIGRAIEYVRLGCLNEKKAIQGELFSRFENTSPDFESSEVIDRKKLESLVYILNIERSISASCPVAVGVLHDLRDSAERAYQLQVKFNESEGALRSAQLHERASKLLGRPVDNRMMTASYARLGKYEQAVHYLAAMAADLAKPGADEDLLDQLSKAQKLSDEWKSAETLQQRTAEVVDNFLQNNLI